MPSGRINTHGKLARWKHDPTRDMSPKERVSTDRSIENAKIRKEEKAKKKKDKEKQLLIKKNGRGGTIKTIKSSSFNLPYSTYKGLTLKVVAKKDPAFIENFIKSEEYSISENVLNELKAIIKISKQKS